VCARNFFAYFFFGEFAAIKNRLGGYPAGACVSVDTCNNEPMLTAIAVIAVAWFLYRCNLLSSVVAGIGALLVIAGLAFVIWIASGGLGGDPMTYWTGTGVQAHHACAEVRCYSDQELYDLTANYKGLTGRSPENVPFAELLRAYHDNCVKWPAVYKDGCESLPPTANLTQPQQ
jgi:hypothetical protein